MTHSATDRRTADASAILVALVLFGWSMPVALSQCQYDVTILEGPSCPFWDQAALRLTGIASDGTVSGSFEQCYPFETRDEGFTWSPNGGAVVIPRPPGVITLTAEDVNSRHQVAVNMASLDDGYGSLTSIFDGRTFILIGTLPGGTNSTVTAINDHGDACGSWGNTVTGPIAIGAFGWLGGALIDLTPYFKPDVNYAFDISNNGTIVGRVEESGPVTTYREGFIWNPARTVLCGFLWSGGTSALAAVNDQGEAVGSASVPADTTSGFATRAVLWREGELIDLGAPLGFVSSAASDINEHSVIVGSAWIPSSSLDRAHIWLDAKITDLNTLIDPIDTLEIESTNAINDSGVIAANGRYQGEFVGIVLTPRTKSPADLTGDCQVNESDLSALLRVWGLPPAAGSDADLDDSGIVDGTDLAMLLAAWG